MRVCPGLHPERNTYFNPRTPRGGASGASPVRSPVRISIHAPHEGVRCETEGFYGLVDISIHAPHEGVRVFGGCGVNDFPISIHAPHEGVRVFRELSADGYYISIHAPHEGVRVCPGLHPERNTYFNPRTPRGGASGASPVRSPVRISIHAPHEGVRCETEGFYGLVDISIHAPHEGVRVFGGCGVNDFPISIHAPHEGVRKGFPDWDAIRNISIHAPHEGVRAWVMDSFVLWTFQSTHPTRGCDAICCSLISRVTTCCRPNITPLLDVVRFLNYCTNLLLFLGEPPRLFRTASGSPMSLHY